MATLATTRVNPSHSTISLLSHRPSLCEVVDGDVGLVGDGVEAVKVLDPAPLLLPLLGVRLGQVRVVGPAAVEVRVEPRAVHAVVRPRYRRIRLQ